MWKCSNCGVFRTDGIEKIRFIHNGLSGIDNDNHMCMKIKFCLPHQELFEVMIFSK